MAKFLRFRLKLSRRAAVVSFSLLVVFFCWAPIIFAKEPINIGILVDGPYWSNQPLINSVHQELNKLTEGQFKIVYPKEAYFNGGYDSKKINLYGRKLAANKKLDIILSLGTETALVFSKMDPLPVPVVAMGYLSSIPVELGLIDGKTLKSTNPNWTTSWDPLVAKKAIQMLPKLTPFKKITIICSHFLCDRIPSVVDAFKSIAVRRKIKIDFLVVSPKNFQEKISGLQTSMVFVPGVHGFSEPETISLFKALAEKKIPSYTGDGLYGIERGALASLEDVDFVKEGRNYALRIFDILHGITPGDLPVKDILTTKLTFNRDTARKIGYGIPLEYVDEARLYGGEEPKPPLPFEEAIQIALDQNYEIKIQALVRDQALKEIEVVRSDYFPQVGSNLNYSRLDTTRADSSVQPRGETNFQLSLKQKIYDRELLKSIETAKYSSNVEKKDLEVVNQDITEQTALAYLDNLLGQELVGIRKEFLKIIRKNRDIAQLKFDLKETGKGDLLRLDIDLENARISLVNAQNDLFNAKVRLNNLLNLPRETRHQFMPVPFSEKAYLEREKRFDSMFLSEKTFKLVRDFVTEETLSSSVSLQSVDESINQVVANKERVKSQFFPTAEFNTSWFQRLQRNTRSLNAIEKNSIDAFDNGWQAEISLNFPLFLGGSRFKSLEQANVQVMEFQARKKDLINNLTERARTDLYRVYKNRRNVDYSIRNVKSSRQNLKLGEVSYREGDLPIIDLLDSQTRLIDSLVSAVSARYQFYQSLFNMFRTMGRTDLIAEFLDTFKVELFRRRMQEFVAQRMSGPPQIDEKSPVEEGIEKQ